MFNAILKAAASSCSGYNSCYVAKGRYFAE